MPTRRVLHLTKRDRDQRICRPVIYTCPWVWVIFASLSAVTTYPCTYSGETTTRGDAASSCSCAFFRTHVHVHFGASSSIATIPILASSSPYVGCASISSPPRIDAAARLGETQRGIARYPQLKRDPCADNVGPYLRAIIPLGLTN